MDSLFERLIERLNGLFQSKHSILIVEDHEETAAFLCIFLKNHGYRVKRAGDGQQGFELAMSTRPDLVLLDITMPKMDGKETLRQLKNHARTEKIPVLMCTERSELDEVEKCCLWGAVGYILKPFETQRLLTKVEETLRDSKR